MSVVVLLARLVLAVVFLVAGLAKLADLAGSRQAMRDFGVPAQLATPFGTLLPLAELAWLWRSSPPSRLGGPPWERSRSCCYSWQASATIWHADARPTVIVSANCTRPPLAGLR